MTFKNEMILWLIIVLLLLLFGHLPIKYLLGLL